MKTLNLKDPKVKAFLVKLAEQLFGNSGFTLSGDRAQLRQPFLEPNVVFIASRGMGKSMLAGVKALLYSYLIPGFKTLYIVPEDRQRKTFNKETIVPLILSSKPIRKLFPNDEAVKHYSKMFLNGSLIDIENLPKTGDPTKLRGKHPDLLIVDEAQDVSKTALDVIYPALDPSDYGWIQYYGTVKTKDRLSWQIWLKSKQIEWGIKCEHCDHWNVPLGAENIGKAGPICARCGRPIDPRNGKWIAMNPESDLPGYRFNHLMAWWMTNKWRIVLARMRDLDEDSFKNEILGEPTEIGDSPINEKLVRKYCNSTLRNGQIDLQQARIAGIDWQGEVRRRSTTVVAVLEKRASYWQLVGMKRFTGQEAELSRLPKAVKNFLIKMQVDYIFADWGGGMYPNDELSRAYNDDPLNPDAMKFFQIEYVGNQKELVRWNPNLGRFVANKYQAVQFLIDTLRSGKLRFFNWDEFKEFFSDFSNLEYVENKVGYPRWEKANREMTDDALHATVFALLGAYIVSELWGWIKPIDRGLLRKQAEQEAYERGSERL